MLLKHEICNQGLFTHCLNITQIYSTNTSHTTTNITNKQTNNKTNRDFGETADPVCVIQVFDTKKCTAIHHDSLNVTFDERITFHFENMQSVEMGRGKIQLSVFDSNKVLSNKLIGSCEIDLEQIYFAKHHELYHQWMAITDFKDINNDKQRQQNNASRFGVQGYLLVTLVVLGPNDEQYIRSEAEESLGIQSGVDFKLLNVMMPPRIEFHPFTLKLNILEAQYLAALDNLSKSSDPYVIVEFVETQVRTRVIKSNLNPEFYEYLQIGVMEPLLADTIVIRVMDFDRGVNDDLVGVITLSYKDIKENGYALGLPRWYHLYGAPPDTWADTFKIGINKIVNSKDRQLAADMNEGLVPGVCYRGSIMLSAAVDDSTIKNKRQSLGLFGGKLVRLTKRTLSFRYKKGQQDKRAKKKHNRIKDKKKNDKNKNDKNKTSIIKNDRQSKMMRMRTKRSVLRSRQSYQIADSGLVDNGLFSDSDTSDSDSNSIFTDFDDDGGDGVPLGQEMINSLTQPSLHSYFLEIDCYEAVECRGGKGSFAIRVVIRSLVIETDFVECDELGHCGWYQMMALNDSYSDSNKITLNFPLDLTQCPDIFFYLMYVFFSFFLFFFFFCSSSVDCSFVVFIFTVKGFVVRCLVCIFIFWNLLCQDIQNFCFLSWIAGFGLDCFLFLFLFFCFFVWCLVKRVVM